MSMLLWIMAKSAYGIVVVGDSLEVIDTLDGDDNEKEIHTVESDQISKKLETWLSSAGKSYCREGITLSDVAKEIEVSPRVLSGYINNSMGMNFRRWINTLRIEEAKRIMENNPEEKLTYVATVCGYADLPSFSKAFRMTVGCSPRDYCGLQLP